MNKYEISKIIEEFAPTELTESWDCVGWVVDSTQDKVKKVLLALTITDDIVRQAREQNCDMIISHHPLFFVPLEYKDINIYCAHTNLDRTQGGTTDELIRVLGFESALIPHSQKTRHPELVSGSLCFLRYVELSNPYIIQDFAQKLKSISKNIRLVNNKNISTIKKIAFCAGSGSDFIQEAIENGTDTFVTGDVKFHTALESEIAIFDIGHFESEIHILKVIKKLLPSNIEIIFAEEKSPFETI